MIGLSNGMGPGGAGGLQGEVGPLCAVVDRDKARSHIADDHRNEKRADLLGTGFEHLLMGFLDGKKPSKAATDHHADPGGELGIILSPESSMA